MATNSVTVPFIPSDIPTGLQGYWDFNSDKKETSGTPQFDTTLAAEIMSNIAAAERGYGAKFNGQAQNEIEVGAVRFRLQKLGTPVAGTARLVARFYSVTNGGLADTLLAESTTQIHPDTGLTTAWANYDFSFAPGFTLPRKCILMIEFTDNSYTPDGANHVNVGQAVLNGNGVPQNTRIQKSNADVYSSGTGNDLFFQILDSTTTDDFLEDRSSNGYDLTNNNAVIPWGDGFWCDGKSAVKFNGTNSYLTRSHASSPNLDITGSFSISMLIRPDAFGTFMALMGKGVHGGTSGYHFSIDTTGKLHLSVQATSVTSTRTLNRHRWYHVGVVFDDTNNWATFYVDGKAELPIAVGVSPASTTEQFAIGSRANTAPALLFGGEMRDAAIWNVPLTSEQMNSLGSGIDVDGLAYRPDDVSVAPTAWWKLNEESNATGAVSRADSSGAHTLTDVNTVTSGRGYIEGAGAEFTTANSEYLEAADSPDWDFGTGDFSFCTWFQKKSNVWNALISPNGIYSSAWFNVAVSDVGSGTIDIYTMSTNIAVPTANHPPFVLDNWYHIAVVRRSGTMYVYLDGKEVHSVANAINIQSTNTIRLGHMQSPTNYYANTRMQDTAVWKGYGITEAEVQSLAAGMPLQQAGLVAYWKLNEGMGKKTLTARGTAQVSTAINNPFGNNEGNLLLDGNSDWLECNQNADLGFRTEDLTIDFFIYFNGVGVIQALVDNNSTANWGIYLTAAGALHWYTGGVSRCSFSWTPSTGVWYHVAVTRASGTARIFIDGVQQASGADAYDNVSYSETTIGAYISPTNFVNGYYSNFRLSRSIARWTSNFTPPTDYHVPDEFDVIMFSGKGTNGQTTFDDLSGDALDNGTRRTTQPNDGAGGFTLAAQNSPSFGYNSRTGRLGVLLNGTNQFLNRGQSTAPGSEQSINMSMTAWYTPTIASGQRQIATKGASSTTGEWNWRLDGANNHIFEVGQTGGLNNPSRVTVTANQDYFGAGVWYGNGARIYVDNLLLGWRFGDEGINSKDGVFVGNEHSFKVGTNQGQTQFFQGLISDKTLWSRDLKEDEVKSIFLKGSAGKDVTSTEIPPVPPVVTDIENRGLFLTFPV